MAALRRGGVEVARGELLDRGVLCAAVELVGGLHVGPLAELAVGARALHLTEGAVVGAEALHGVAAGPCGSDTARALVHAEKILSAFARRADDCRAS